MHMSESRSISLICCMSIARMTKNYLSRQKTRECAYERGRASQGWAEWGGGKTRRGVGTFEFERWWLPGGAVVIAALRVGCVYFAAPLMVTLMLTPMTSSAMPVIIAVMKMPMCTR
jgi:hypothetical protein